MTIKNGRIEPEGSIRKHCRSAISFRFGGRDTVFWTKLRVSEVEDASASIVGTLSLESMLVASLVSDPCLGCGKLGLVECRSAYPYVECVTTGRASLNPYSRLPDTAFWDRSVSKIEPELLDPVTDVPFRLSPEDRIATAGSCFAQHISRTLVERGYNYLVTEQGVAPNYENYGIFPARFGNIYTVRQLIQLFDRAYSIFVPRDNAWSRHDGAVVDPFRPRIQAAGFGSTEALETDRRSHLAAVRRMFEGCDVFIFTLGLSEGWLSREDGAVFPLAPGVAGGTLTDNYEFQNFSVGEMTADLSAFLRKLRAVNPHVRVILTVSPVALKATYEPRHVLVSNTYSKAALRVVAEEVSQREDNVAYFPSFEIVTNAGARFYDRDRRNVRPEGVAHVMSVFSRHFLASGDSASVAAASPRRSTFRYHDARTIAAPSSLAISDYDRLSAAAEIVCEEEALAEG